MQTTTLRLTVSCRTKASKKCLWKCRSLEADALEFRHDSKVASSLTMLHLCRSPSFLQRPKNEGSPEKTQ